MQIRKITIILLAMLILICSLSTISATDVNLTVTKKVTTDNSQQITTTALQGQIIKYNVTVTNNGFNNATNVNVTEKLDPKLTFLNATASTGTSYDSSSGIWTIGDLGVGESSELLLRLRVDGIGSITSNATVNCDENNLLPNDTRVTINSYSNNITVKKTTNGDKTTYLNGDTIDFIITVQNNAPWTVYLTAIDILPGGLVFDRAITNYGSYDKNTGIWSIGSIAPGEAAVLTLLCKVDYVGDLTNEVNVNLTGDDNPSGSGIIYPIIINDKIDIICLPAVNLTVSKSVTSGNNSNHYNGNQITYTITISNRGPNNCTNLTIDEVLDSRLILLSNTTSSGHGYYDPVDGKWYLGTLNVGQTAYLYLTVRLNGTGQIWNNISINSTGENNTNKQGNSSVVVNVLPSVNVTVNKTVNATNASAGDKLTYTITVINNGPDNATNVTVNDIFDSRTTYSSSYTDNGTFNNSTGTWVWNIGNLTVNQIAMLTINVTINNDAYGMIVNKVTLTTTERNIGITSSNATTNVPGDVNVTVVKIVDLTQANVGDYLTYTINVTNNGPHNASNVQVYDFLDSRLIFNYSTASSGTYYDYSTGIWDIGTLNVGSTVTLTINVRIKGSGTIKNNATVSTSDDNRANPNETFFEVETNVSSATNITVNKSVNATSGVNGDKLIYIITVTNNGPNPDYNVNITDKLDSRLILDSIILSQGSYNNVTGLWEIGTINSGRYATLTLYVTINGTGTIKNNATVTTEDNNLGNNYSEVSTRIQGYVNLTVTKNVTKNEALNGDKLIYTITIKNNGPDDATEVEVYDFLNSKLIYNSHDASNGNSSYNPNNGTWNIGNLATGQTVTLSISVTINGTGTIENNATASVFEINVGDTFDRVVTEVFAAVNLTITKNANKVKAFNHDELIYTITVTNNGPNVLTTAVITDKLDSRLIFNGYVCSPNGAYNPDNGEWMFYNLGIGQSATLTIYVTINGTGNITNNVTVITLVENNTGDNFTQVETEVLSLVNVTVTKEILVNETTNERSKNSTALNRDKIIYIITVTNNGPENATDVYVSDFLSPKIIYNSHDASNGNGSYNPNNGTWDIGNLAVNQTLTLTITGTFNGTGTILNNATVTTNENNIGDNFSIVETEVLPLVNITIIKTVNATSVINHDLLTYVITVSNHGPNESTDVNVTEILDNRLVLLSNSSTQGNYDGITWNIGNISMGETVSLTLYVRTNGTASINNFVTVETKEENIGNKNASISVLVNPNINLTVTKTANTTNVFVGQNVQYTITVFNSGLDEASGVEVYELLPNGLIYLNSSTSKGTYNSASGLWIVGNLNSGEKATFIINTRVANEGKLTNVVTVTTITRESDIDSANATILATKAKDSITVRAKFSSDYKTMFITGRLVDGSGKPLANRVIDLYVQYLGEKHKLSSANFNGKYIGSAITDSNGIFSLNYTTGTSFKVGDYSVISSFKGDNIYLPCYATCILERKNNTISTPGDKNITQIGNNTTSTSGAKYNGVNASMKKTGVPLIAILILLIGNLTSVNFRKKQK